MGARRQRLVLRWRQAHLRVGRRRSHSWRRQPHHGAASWIQAVLPAEVRAARSCRQACSSVPRRSLFAASWCTTTCGAIGESATGISRIRWRTTSRARSARLRPETKPVRFFLNGEYYGPFVLTERFDERFFAAHWGYDDILLSQEEMNKLWEWVRTTRPLTMEQGVAAREPRQSHALVRRGGVFGDAATRIRGLDSFSTGQRHGRLVLGQLGHGPELPRLEPRQLSVPAGAGRRENGAAAIRRNRAR